LKVLGAGAAIYVNIYVIVRNVTNWLTNCRCVWWWKIIAWCMEFYCYKLYTHPL